MTGQRIPPLEPPYPDHVAESFERIMPKGVPPLLLFRTLARVPRIYDRFKAGSLIDRGPISLRHREIVINRTCARCECAYEWGVHVAFFAERAGLTPGQLAATAHGDGREPVWTEQEQLLIRTVDELHDTARLSDEIWSALSANFSDEQILELIALIGFYHTVSFFANGLKLAPEPFGTSMPVSRAPAS